MEFLRRSSGSPLDFLRPRRLLCRQMRLLGHEHGTEWSALELEALPRAREVIVDIGFVMAVHLAFAVAVVLTLDAFGLG